LEEEEEEEVEEANESVHSCSRFKPP